MISQMNMQSQKVNVHVYNKYIQTDFANQVIRDHYRNCSRLIRSANICGLR